MSVKISWFFRFFVVYFRDGDCYCFCVIMMRCYVEVDDVFDCCVLGFFVVSLVVMSDVVCIS